MARPTSILSAWDLGRKRVQILSASRQTTWLSQAEHTPSEDGTKVKAAADEKPAAGKGGDRKVTRPLRIPERGFCLTASILRSSSSSSLLRLQAPTGLSGSISVLPDTNFSRVVIGMDNGVMPVERCRSRLQAYRRCLNSGPAYAPSAALRVEARLRSACSSTGMWTCSTLCTCRRGPFKVQQTLPDSTHHYQSADLRYVFRSWAMLDATTGDVDSLANQPVGDCNV